MEQSNSYPYKSKTTFKNFKKALRLKKSCHLLNEMNKVGFSLYFISKKTGINIVRLNKWFLLYDRIKDGFEYERARGKNGRYQGIKIRDSGLGAPNEKTFKKIKDIFDKIMINHTDNKKYISDKRDLIIFYINELKSKGISKYKICKDTGLSHLSIRNWFLKKNTPINKTIVRICKTYEMLGYSEIVKDSLKKLFLV